jgi:2-polyprenyl-3-methyl-5-hydroxy-6-metoxy-1,4-benzoquinol methylase
MIGGCCSFEDEAGRQFDARKAAKEVFVYRKRGPGATTRLLRDAITDACAARRRLLDIGAGIGALTFELLQNGVSHSVAVDASPAYLEAARAEAARRGFQTRITFVQADFVRVARDLESADVVTLDRVVCCYPSYDPLLRDALRLANHCFALSYPRAKFYVKAVMALENGQRRLVSNPFRTYVHPPDAMERIIRDAGFTLATRSETWVWSADV